MAHPDKVPAWRQLADAVRADIEAGTLPPGALLPSEAELVERFSVSRWTVRHALDQLRAEGRIRSIHGRGSFVRQRAQVIRLATDLTGRNPQRGWYAALERAGLDSAVTTTVRVAPVPDDVAELLDVEPGALVVVRERVMGAAGQPPMQLATSHIPLPVAAQAPALHERDTGPGGYLSRLEDAGYGPLAFEEARGARMPTPDEAALLALDPGTPVMTGTRRVFAASGQVLDVMRRVVDASRVEEIERIEAAG